jgi:tetratricopeptide (TPR) repeat protein
VKIHPSDLAFEELLAFPDAARGGLLDHLERCADCRERFRELAAARPGTGSPAAIAATPAIPANAAIAATPATPASPATPSGSPDTAVAPARSSSSSSSTSASPDPEFDRLVASTEALQAAIARERLAAEALLPELLAVPASGRLRALHEDARFANWGLLERLIERAREESFTSPQRGQELAHLALELAARLDGEHYRPELIEDMRARAWAALGNALRLIADHPAAQRAFDAAYAHLRRGSQDPLERAMLLELRASLRRDQRRLPSAARLWQRALDHYLEVGERHRAGRVLINLSTVHNVAGRPEQAIALLYRALELIDAEREPRVLLCARHDLIDDLADAGRFAEAQQLYEATLPLYERFAEPATSQRRRWVEAKILAGRGQLARGEALFAAARDGFLAAEMPFDAALVTLDLAALYFQQGRHAELRRVAEEMLPTFAGLDLHREALSALAFLRSAIEGERADREVLSTVAAYLKRSQHDPALTFAAAPGS